jgi:Cu(I)/Ag(I) efflux system membrane fusion protein
MDQENESTSGGNHQHSEHLSELVDRYLSMKEMLSNDRLEGAKNQLAGFKKEVMQNKEMNEHPEHSVMHQEHHAAMVEALRKASKTEDIQAFRSSFAEVSKQLVKAVENQGFEDKELYWQYCPMAENNKGAYWLDDQKEIANPYMGQQMPGCGSTEKTISENS